jgi:hypothetical protein
MGEGGLKGRVRGAEILFFTPHPPLRGTLSLRERDSPILRIDRSSTLQETDGEFGDS